MSVVLDNAHSEKSREWLTEGKSGCCRAFAEHNCLCACSCSVGGRQGALAMPKRVSADSSCRDQSQKELRAVDLGLAEGPAAGLLGDI